MRHRFPWRWIIGTGIILTALVVLIIPSLQSGAQYYLTVEELLQDSPRYQEETVRVSGAVIGESIDWDADAGVLSFTIASVPTNLEEIEAAGGFEASLQRAVADSERPRMDVQIASPPPELLQDAAQAILTGRLAADGVFQADELLLKCPSRYQDDQP